MPDINDVIKKADSLVPPLPILRLRPVAGKGGIFDSKLGGTPYFPKSMEYPRGTAAACGSRSAPQAWQAQDFSTCPTL